MSTNAPLTERIADTYAARQAERRAALAAAAHIATLAYADVVTVTDAETGERKERFSVYAQLPFLPAGTHYFMGHFVTLKDATALVRALNKREG